MIITKRFEVESAHIVRNCTSERCSHSIHGHSAKIEVSFTADMLDNAQMILDFGLMKNDIKKFIDSMDHCYLLCSKEDMSYKEFIQKSCDRWIELPFNPSAEMLSMYICWGVNKILKATKMNNGEGTVRCTGVRYWETASGSATCDYELDVLPNEKLFDTIHYSYGVLKDWSSMLVGLFIYNNTDILKINPEVEQQIKL